MAEEKYIQLNVTETLRRVEGLSKEAAADMLISMLRLFQDGLVKTPVKKKRVNAIDRKVPFEQSSIFGKRAFADAFPGWHQDKWKHYYLVAVNQSKKGQSRWQVDWKAAVRVWASAGDAKGLKFGEGDAKAPATAEDKEKAFKERGL